MRSRCIVWAVHRRTLPYLAYAHAVMAQRQLVLYISGCDDGHIPTSVVHCDAHLVIIFQLNESTD